MNSLVNSIEYKILRGMKTRCFNPNNRDWKWYGGKGITIQKDWLEPLKGIENFLRDVGKRPGKGYTIDRIDSNKDYNKDNCRWVPPGYQQRNKSDNVVITFNGKSQIIADWSKELNIPNYQIYNRYSRGLSLDKVFYKGRLPRPKGLKYNTNHNT